MGEINFNFIYGTLAYASINAPNCGLLQQELDNAQNWGGKVLVVVVVAVVAA